MYLLLKKFLDLLFYSQDLIIDTLFRFCRMWKNSAMESSVQDVGRKNLFFSVERKLLLKKLTPLFSQLSICSR
jgi:hypothetical protein